MRHAQSTKTSAPALALIGLGAWLSLSPAAFAQGATGAAGGQELQPTGLVPCPYTPTEIQDAFGVPVDQGQASDMTFPEGRDVGCLYDVQTSSAVITVRQTWGTPQLPSGSGVSERAKERIARPIANDPDGAEWLREKGEPDGTDEKKVRLGYKRAANRVSTEISYYGGVFVASDIRPKLLKLRRVP